jgi:phenylpropionate dioxygenase-like ring-hydroxylating dioxygenase large terminal subunit/AcrR family transcriptional regulator
MSSASEDLRGSDASDKQPRDAVRRRQLIEATISCIAEHGLSGTTVAKVAKLAGLSAGIVNFYFRTKDALLLATLEHVDGEFDLRQQEAIARAGRDPARQLEAMIDVDFDPKVCDPRRIAIWSAFWGESLAREDYLRVCGKREEAHERQVVELFEQVSRRTRDPKLDSEALGRAFYHLLSSLPEKMLVDGENFDFEGAKETCRRFLRSVFPTEFRERAELPAPLPELPAAVPAGEPGEGRLTRTAALPGWVYRNAEFYALERQAIFRREWLLAGHAAQLPKPGDYVTLDAAGERALVIRGNDGMLRGFDNVCRHRASRVVRGESGHCEHAIVCPYHGWSYGFDGGLRAVPGETAFPALDESQVSLPDVEVEEWMGFVFVRFEGGGQTLASLMQPFDEQARHYHFAGMEPCGPRSSSLHDFNWKLFAENQAEGYQLQTGHPGLRRLFGGRQRDSLQGGRASRTAAMLRDEVSSAWSERMYQRLLPESQQLPRECRRAWVYYGIFPGAVIAVGPESVDCSQVVPVGPGQSRIQRFSLALPGDGRQARAARYLKGRINRQVMAEDLEFCGWADDGVDSERHGGGMLSELEVGVRDFRQRIRDLLPVSTHRELPSRGCVAELNERLRDPAE